MRRDEILRALAALGAELAERGLVADLYVVGGAAITLAYDERRATRDIDAVFVPKNEVYAAATRVAAALDLPDGWLNDAVKGFLLGPDRFPTKMLEMPGLRCEVASAETVLVLKCLAHRLGEDDDDVVLLAGQLGLDTADDVLDLVEQVGHPRLLTPQVELFIRSVMDVPEAPDYGQDP
ncbi:MAG: DUF6036 family nucleotidyltransferase [Pseudonocardiaceae bacterium]